MNKNSILKMMAIVAGALAFPSGWAQVPGLPEPGLLIYGPVVNSKTLTAALPTNVVWQVAGGGDGFTVSSKVVVLNGTVYHITRIPFETRVVGSQNLTRTLGTAALNATPTTYQRIVTADGSSAQILDSSRNTLGSFSFSQADRGAVERLTLGVATVPIGGGPTVTNLVIGTTLSVNGVGGLSFSWPAVTGSTYTVLRATNVMGPYLPITPKLTATPPTQSFSDPNPPPANAVFYRVSVLP
jgi:hypothetical protein